MQFGLGAQVDLHTQCIFEFQLQADDAQQRGAGRQIDEQVEIASIAIDALRGGAEDAHAARAVRCGQRQDMVTLRGECLGGTHGRIFAGFESAAARRRGDPVTGRRRFIAGAVGAVLARPFGAAAQAGPRLPRIGILSFEPPPPEAPDLSKGFMQGLAEHGYVEGRNIVIERRYAGGQPQRLAALAAELVQLKVDVILAGGPAPRETASRATASIPIVTISGVDPVAEGWARSLAQPGGNVTGFTVTYNELGPKRLEVLKQAFPALARVAVLMNPVELLDARNAIQELEDGARRLGFQVQRLEVRGPDDFDAAFERARKGRAEVLYAIATNTVVTHRARLAELAARERLMTVSEFPLMALAGFLMTYGADIDELGRRCAERVDKILKGARPGDLPIERPSKLQLIVNSKTARTIGITIPPSLLLQADVVIE